MVCSLLHGNGSNSSHGKQCKPWKRGLEPGIYDSHDGFLGRGTLGEPPNLSEVFFFFFPFLWKYLQTVQLMPVLNHLLWKLLPCRGFDG